MTELKAVCKIFKLDIIALIGLFFCILLYSIQTILFFCKIKY